MAARDGPLPPLAVLVAGGGPVGATLALALARVGVSVALADAAAPGTGPGRDSARRPIALSAASVRILATLEVWPAVAPRACPIRMVHVSEQGRFGMVRLRAQEHGVDALGQVTDAVAITDALDAALDEAPGVVRLRGTRIHGHRVMAERVEALAACGVAPPPAKLLVAAEGGVSVLRERAGIGTERRDYGQCAVVCEVAPDAPHDGVAYERFTPSGPVALLPLADGRCALVWTLPEPRANAVAALEERAFLDALQRAFGHRLGRLRAAGPRTAFPLALVRSRRIVAPRLALAGNAANQLHPVAGQGLNLGLRDAAVLAEVVAACVRRGEDPGTDAALDRYARSRRADHAAVVRFTDALARGFTVSGGLPGRLRSAGLLALDLVPPAGRALARRAMGLAGRQPRLVRGALP